jgi:hypothetical protein
MAGRRLRANYGGGRHGNLHLPAGGVAHANGNADGYAIRYRNCYGDADSICNAHLHGGRHTRAMDGGRTIAA